MKKYVIALDLGTSSLRVILFDSGARSIAFEQREFTQYYPDKKQVEHDPEEIYSKLISATKALFKKNKILAKQVAGIGITNQRETTVIWNSRTGKPVHNAIVWQDNRTEGYCNELIRKGYSDEIKKKTGLVINPYFSASKINWILRNKVKDIKNIKFGTIDSWILWKLTAGKVHATDYSNASRTLLFNINTLEWDDELLKIFSIPKKILPQVKASDAGFGETERSIFGEEINISAIMGDQQSSLFGQLCFNKNDIKATYGTGCFILKNTGMSPVYSENGLLTTIAWGISGKVYYALEASIFNCASIINWLKNNLQLARSGKELDKIAEQVKDSNGISFISSFYGLSAPYWVNCGDAEILGITLSSNKAHITRAALESIIFQVSDVIKLLDTGSQKIRNLSADGGVANSKLMMQMQSDILNIPIMQQKDKEKTASGVAYMTGIKLGMWDTEFLKNKKEYILFEPKKDAALNEAHKNWKKQIKTYIKKHF